MKNINELSGLTKIGFESQTKEFNANILENSTFYNLIRPVIKKYFAKSNTFCYTHSSYSIRNLVKDYVGENISNGELIYAMHQEGYSIKKDGINCYFNIKKSELDSFIYSKEILKILSKSSAVELQRHLDFEKKFLKFKYNFSCIIDSEFMQYRHIKIFVVKVISKEIEEDTSIVRLWFDLPRNSSIEIPEDKYKLLKKIFGSTNDDFLKNNEA